MSSTLRRRSGGISKESNAWSQLEVFAAKKRPESGYFFFPHLERRMVARKKGGALS
jgi:hypothetical protein